MKNRLEVDLHLGSLQAWPTDRLVRAIDRLLKQYPGMNGTEREWGLRAGVTLADAIVMLASEISATTRADWDVRRDPNDPAHCIIRAGIPAEQAAAALLGACSTLHAALPLHLQGVSGLDRLRGVVSERERSAPAHHAGAIAVLEPT